MDSIEKVRREIDSVDDAIADLFVRRMELADRIAEAKRESGTKVADPAREHAILSRIAAKCGPELEDAAKRIYSTLFAISRERQRFVMRGESRLEGVKVAVAGLGLIGGSLLKAAKAVGYETIAIHHGDDVKAVDADFLFVAMPPAATVPWIRDHAGAFREGCVIMDVCGVKRPVVEGLAGVERRGWVFLPAHPMAGREKGGFENSTASLFMGASMIVTPGDDVPPAALEAAKNLFSSLGFASTVVTTPERHDEMISFTSQLCHVIASAYARDERVADSIGFSAGSYANMTRIATMDENTWADLFLSDADKLVPVIDGFVERMLQYRDAVRDGDREALKAIILEGAEAKRRELKARGEENA